MAIINASGADTLFQLYEERGLRWSNGRPDAGIVKAFYDEMNRSGRRASTLASAIEIAGRRSNLKKAAHRSLDVQQRSFAGSPIRRFLPRCQSGSRRPAGSGARPASTPASVAGVRLLRQEGVIASSDRVVCILTGHQLKDPTTTVAYHANDAEQFERVLGKQGVTSAPYANNPIQVENDLGKIMDRNSRV